jgi:phosphoheptose isomerase
MKYNIVDKIQVSNIKKNKHYRELLFFQDYYKKLKLTIDNINLHTLSLISNFLKKKIIKNKKIFVAGNGGSAAIANHLLCDFNKGVKISSKNKIKPRIISLVNSIESITAISNDISYDKIFTFQLQSYYEKGDCLICYSSSGQSKNIIDVINFANKNNINTILFQGFGNLNKKIKPDYYLNLNYRNYGITEDIFQSTIHAISQHIRVKFKSKNEIL